MRHEKFISVQSVGQTKMVMLTPTTIFMILKNENKNKMYAPVVCAAIEKQN
jgi:hypothetical protein